MGMSVLERMGGEAGDMFYTTLSEPHMLPGASLWDSGNSGR